jgi:hypothetical protein
MSDSNHDHHLTGEKQHSALPSSGPFCESPSASSPVVQDSSLHLADQDQSSSALSSESPAAFSLTHLHSHHPTAHKPNYQSLRHRSSVRTERVDSALFGERTSDSDDDIERDNDEVELVKLDPSSLADWIKESRFAETYTSLQRRAHDSICDRLMLSPLAPLGMDLAVLAKSLLASLAVLSLLQPASLTSCFAFPISYQNSQGETIQGALPPSYVENSVCNPRLEIDGVREALVVLISFNIMFFLAVIVLKHTGTFISACHSSFMAFLVAFLINMLGFLFAITKMCMVVYATLVPLSFGCESDFASGCTDRSVKLDVSKNGIGPDCQSDCIDTIGCGEQCTTVQSIELYFLICTFPLAFMYVSYLSFEIYVAHKDYETAVLALKYYDEHYSSAATSDVEQDNDVGAHDNAASSISDIQWPPSSHNTPLLSSRQRVRGLLQAPLQDRASPTMCFGLCYRNQERFNFFAAAAVARREKLQTHRDRSFWFRLFRDTASLFKFLVTIGSLATIFFSVQVSVRCLLKGGIWAGVVCICVFVHIISLLTFTAGA